MNKSGTSYTLNAEAAAARCRELLTTDTPPPAGRALSLRLHQPPSIIVKSNTLPYEERMWSPAGVDQWCAERQPPRIRKALACLERLESAEAAYARVANLKVGAGPARAWVREILVEILAAGKDEP